MSGRGNTAGDDGLDDFKINGPVRKALQTVIDKREA